MSWRQEFGAEYTVPVDKVSGLVDLSWHNDVCPSFTTAAAMCHVEALDEKGRDSHFGQMPRLWVDHPQEDGRECNGAYRYFVCNTDGDEFYGGDDVDAAIKALRDACEQFLMGFRA